MKSFVALGLITLSALFASGASADCIPGYMSNTMDDCDSHCGDYVCITVAGQYQCGYCQYQ